MEHGIRRVSNDDAEETPAALFLGHEVVGRRFDITRPSHFESQRGTEYITDGLVRDELLHLTDEGAGAGLQTDDCLGAALLGCGVHFLSLRQVGSEGPFDEDVFACFDAGHEQGVVSVYSDGADNEVDIWVLS